MELDTLSGTFDSTASLLISCGEPHLTCQNTSSDGYFKVCPELRPQGELNPDHAPPNVSHFEAGWGRTDFVKGKAHVGIQAP